MTPPSTMPIRRTAATDGQQTASALRRWREDDVLVVGRRSTGPTRRRSRCCRRRGGPGPLARGSALCGRTILLTASCCCGRSCWRSLLLRAILWRSLLLRAILWRSPLLAAVRRPCDGRSCGGRSCGGRSCGGLCCCFGRSCAGRCWVTGSDVWASGVEAAPERSELAVLRRVAGAPGPGSRPVGSDRVASDRARRIGSRRPLPGRRGRVLRNDRFTAPRR